LTQVAKNHFAFATALLWHYSFEITLKLYLYGKYSIQTMIFWSLCAFIWFKNIEKMLLQMTSGFLQLQSKIVLAGILRCSRQLNKHSKIIQFSVIFNGFVLFMISKVLKNNFFVKREDDLVSRAAV
jgi:hypothetical protein